MKTSIRGIATLLLVCILLCGLFAPKTAPASEGNIDTTNKYAWSENGGWLNFRPTNGGVTVHGTYLSGYAWAENIGWIKLGSGTGPYDNNSSTNWGVNRDSSTGALSGYAWSENAGWVNFNPTNSQVIINTSTGKFSGYAWAENVGWIHFQNASPEYYVQVAVAAGTYYVDIASGNDSNNGSSANPWKTLHYAIDQINGGAAGTYILIMAAGTYSIGNGESVAALIISQSNVTIIGPDHHTIGAGIALIDGTGTSTGDWIYGINTTGSNITIRDLSIKNFSNTSQCGIYMSASTGTEVVNCKISNNDTGIHIAAGSDAFKIRFCEIYSNNTDGLYVIGSTDGEIYRNTIHTHQTANAEGIYVNGCSPAIKRNKIYDNKTGIKVYANSTASPVISNNIIYETEEYEMNYGIRVYGDGGVASPTIYHNTIDGGTGDGIAIEIGSSSTLEPVIKYNIITRCEGVGIDADAGVTCAPDYNDVWGNGTQYSNECTAGANDISQDPKNGPPEFKLPSDSPCIDKIPATDPPGDPVTMDYYGYTRPGGTTSTSKDMGACEYIAQQTYTDTLPGGTGLVTDYRIFTIPLDIGTGAAMRTTLEGTLGAYDPTRWRVFARTTNGDIEMNTQAFASLDIKPGMGFWGITVLTDTISFQGTLAPDAIYYRVELAPGWNLFAVPWPDTSIELGKIYVSDGVNQYVITDQQNNTLTQPYIWDYTGSSGYVQRSTSGFPLVAGTGYFIKVLGSSNIILSIPPDNSSDPPNNGSVSTSHTVSYESLGSVRLPDDSEPPPLPDGSYGPMPDIKANGKSGPLTVSHGTPVSITVSLDPGNRPVKKADWWVVARTPFKPPFDWYSYVYPTGWQPGIHVCVQTPPFQVPPSFEVLNMALPKGNYTLYFALDENADGIVDETWVDSVEVRVE